MFRKRLLIAGIVAAVAAAAAGCGGTSDDGSASGTTAASSDAPVKIAFANATNASQGLKGLGDNVVASARAVGFPITSYDNNLDGATALRNARLMVQDDPQVIIEFNGVEGVSRSLEALFQRANIPCIAVNTPGAGGCAWFNLYNQQLCGDTGKVMAHEAERRRWTGDDTSVILVNAAGAGREINTCMGFFYEQLQDGVEGLARIDSWRDIEPTTSSVGDTTLQVDGRGLLESSFTAVTNALQSIPADRNVILYTVNDDSAVGAWQAVQRSGRADKAMIAGLGGFPNGIKQLRTNPNWIAEGDFFQLHWGQYLIAIAKAIADGAEPPQLTTSPQAILTKEEVDVPGVVTVPLSRYYRDGATTPFRLPPLEPVAERETSRGPAQVGNGYLADTGILQQFGNVEGLR